MAVVIDGTNGITVPASSSGNSGAVAWVRFQGGNGNTAGTILASYNVGSITVNGTGDYTVNFTNSLVDSNYSAIGCGDTNNGVSAQHINVFWSVASNSAVAPTSSACRVSNTSTGAGTNTANICVAIFR